VKFVVLTVVRIQIPLFCGMMLCGLVGGWH